MSVFVVGSINHDVVIDVPKLPEPGQTLAGLGLTTAHGGKGMNQAIACSLAGADTRLVGRVGNDEPGRALVEFAARHGVDVAGVRPVPGPTGTAHVFHLPGGDNCIVITAGANGEVDESAVESGLAELAAGDVLVVQGEIPTAATAHAMELASAAGARIVLNLAPVVAPTQAELSSADPLVVNEVEAAAVLGVSPAGVLGDPDRAVSSLAVSRSAVITLGPRGAVVGYDGSVTLVPPPPVERVVDTTGAGDAFVGVLAARLSQGCPLSDAARSAVRAATLSVAGLGAADSYSAAFSRC